MPNKHKESSEKPAFEDAGLGFVYKSLINRDPNKRRIKPVESVLCTTFGEDLDDSESDDSDYKPTKVDDEEKEGEKKPKVNGKKRQRKKQKVEGNEEVKEEEQNDKEETQNGPEGEDDPSGSDSGSSSESSSSSESDEEEDEEEEEVEEVEGGLDSIDSTLDAVLKQSTDFVEPSTSQDASSSKVTDADLVASRSKKIVICAVCLGDVSQPDDEIVECDACGISVHELCYGITSDDAESIHSNASSASTEPWFCDPCKAGIKNPLCELCPNLGGIYKITENGRWIHMVCALYTHGVTFSEPDKLRGPILTGLPHNRWGSKTCSLCEDSRFMQSGVCAKCDAGMCRTFFHVTCAQREGLLLELRGHSEEEQVPDPYIAYCRLHSDREAARKKKRNYLSLQAKNRYLFKTQQQVAKLEDGITNERTLCKLQMQRDKFLKSLKEFECSEVPDPTIKPIPRLLDSSPRAIRRLTARCELAGIHTRNPHFSIEDILDIRRKWHIQPAFSPEFITYYHDRNDRITAMAKQSHELNLENKRLKETEASVFAKYNELLSSSEQLKSANEGIRAKIRQYLTILGSFVNPVGDDMVKMNSFKLGQQVIALSEMQPPGKSVEGTELDGSANESTTGKSSSKKKDGEGPPNKVFQLKECAACKKTKEQHLLALCDRCHLYYHLHCLDPPLRRMPKKTRSCGWQCSNCTEKDEEEQNEDGLLEIAEPEVHNGTISNEDSSTPSEQPVSSTTTATTVSTSRRRLRENPKTVTKYLEHEMLETPISRGRPRATRPSSTGSSSSATSVTPTPPGSASSSTNTRRGRRPRTNSTTNSTPPASTSTSNTPTSSTSSRKRKLSVSSPVAPPPQPLPSESPTTTITIESEDQNEPEGKIEAKSVASKPNLPTKKNPVIQCATCQKEVSSKQSVRCDNCQNSYHFACLDPPCSKNPKRRGYTWCCYVCEKNEDNKHSKSHAELEKAHPEKAEKDKDKVEEKQKPKSEREKIEKDKVKVEKDKTEKMKTEKEKVEKVKGEKEKTEKTKVEKEKVEKVKVEKEKIEKVKTEKMEKDKVENDKEEKETAPPPEKRQRKSSGESKARISNSIKDSKLNEGQSLLAKEKCDPKPMVMSSKTENQGATSSSALFASPKLPTNSLLSSSTSPVSSVQQVKIPPTIEIPDVIFKSKSSPTTNHFEDEEDNKDEEETEEDYLASLDEDARTLKELLDPSPEADQPEEIAEEEPIGDAKSNEVQIESISEFQAKS